jgi:hypothetical protein
MMTRVGVEAGEPGDNSFRSGIAMSMTTMLARLRRLFSIVQKQTALPVILSVVVLAEGCLTNDAGMTSLWEQGKGNVPDRFVYLCFPVNHQVELVGSNNVATGQYLARAVMCSEQELRSQEPIAVWQGTQELRVPKELLTANPQLQNRDDLVAKWQEAVKLWGDETDWAFVSATFTKLPNGGTRVTLHRKDKAGTEEEFQYSFKDGLYPEKWVVNKVSNLAN